MPKIPKNYENMNITYIMKKEVIDKSNISKFLINLSDRRNIREGKVKEIYSSLKTGIHFSAPFVVNEVGDIWKLLDGNHRFEAIHRLIKEDKDFKITVWMAVYRDLTPNGEREVYKLWNIGTPQSSTDFLKAYFNTIPLGKQIITKLPVTIYGDKQNMPMKHFVGCQICAKENGKFQGGYSVPKEQVIDDFRDLTVDDLEMLEDFYEFMKECFGEYHKKDNSQFYQTTPISAFYRIWYDNQVISNARMTTTFKKTFSLNPNKWKDFTKSGGRSASQTFYRVAIQTLNGLNKTLHFKDDDEVIKEREKINKVLLATNRKK